MKYRRRQCINATRCPHLSLLKTLLLIYHFRIKRDKQMMRSVNTKSKKIKKLLSYETKLTMFILPHLVCAQRLTIVCWGTKCNFCLSEPKRNNNKLELNFTATSGDERSWEMIFNQQISGVETTHKHCFIAISY